MPLVSATCLGCGGTLMVDDQNETAVCQYCGTLFIVEKAINNYNTYNSYNFDNAEVHIYNEQSFEKKLSNAETFLTVHRDFEKAYIIFEQIANESPKDYRGWWGKVRAFTHDFSNLEIAIEKISGDVSRALNVASMEVKQKINQTWQEYCNRYDEMRCKREKNEREWKEERERREQEKKREYDLLLRKSVQLSNSCHRLCKWSKILLAIAIVFGGCCISTGDKSVAGVFIICVVILITLIFKWYASNEKHKTINTELERNPYWKDKRY